MGDPYQEQLWTTARLIAQRAGLREDQWSWSYQSEGRSPEPWLQPQLEDHVPTLMAERGIDKVVSLAIGFVSDHVEILFDIDIEAQKAAKESDMTLVRPPSLNDDPRFVAPDRGAGRGPGGPGRLGRVRRAAPQRRRARRCRCPRAR